MKITGEDAAHIPPMHSDKTWIGIRWSCERCGTSHEIEGASDVTHVTIGRAGVYRGQAACLHCGAVEVVVSGVYDQGVLAKRRLATEQRERQEKQRVLLRDMWIGIGGALLMLATIYTLFWFFVVHGGL